MRAKPEPEKSAMFPFASEVFALGGFGGGGGTGSLIAQFFPLILIFIIFWFLLIRPQQKKAKAHRQLVANLKKGDDVLTDGGIRGTIQKVADDQVTLEIAPKVPIRIQRSRISEIIKVSKEIEPKAKAEK